MYGAFVADGRVHVLLEWADRGNLYDFFKFQPNQRFSEDIVVFITRVATRPRALIYCHKFNVMHRDLKPENILLTSGVHNDEVVVKLADFGWAIETSSQAGGAQSAVRTTYCGTVDYMAPELAYKQQYDMRVESWSFGVLIYELLTGITGSDERMGSQTCDDAFLPLLDPPEPLYKSYKGDQSLSFPEGTSSEAKDIIFQLLQKNPDDRLSLERAVEHPFFRNTKYRVFH